MKKKGFKLLALAVITACCFGISAVSAFAADGETKTAMNGASIRTNEPNGLRFEAVVDEATYYSVIEDDGKSFGAFILPKDYLTNANITEITDHKEQFVAPTVEKYLEKEDIEGESQGSDYVLKYSIAQLHYYNYNRVFVGMFFIKTVGADNAVSYQYFTVNEANNERSVAFVAKAAIENGSDVPDPAYDFAIAAKYLEVNGYDSTEAEDAQKSEADAFVTANKEGFKTAYAAIKAAADIETINILDESQKPKIQAARKAYDEADPVIKDLLDDFAIYDKFVANETAYQEAEAAGLVETVNNAIAALPEYNASTVPVVYNKNYKTAKVAYDSLTEEQKAQITDYAKLQEYEAAAAKVKLIYEEDSYAIYSNTDTKFNVGTPDEESFIISIEGIPEELSEYGFISKVWANDAARNVRLGFKNLPDLTGYDVVRFPIYLSPDQVGANSYNLVYKFENESLTGGYRKLTAGWNIVTIPVSKMYEGIVIGANMIPAKTILHYAIPYAEKLENGDKISTFAYETHIANSTITSFTDAYRANVSFDKVQTDEGNILKVVTSTGSGGAGENYAFRMNDYEEYQTIVADSGATGVEFKIYKNGTGGRVALYVTEDTSGHDKGIKEITLQNDGWVTVSLTAEEFARWNGYFRRTWGAGTELYVADFTIVK